MPSSVQAPISLFRSSQKTSIVSQRQQLLVTPYFQRADLFFPALPNTQVPEIQGTTQEVAIAKCAAAAQIVSLSDIGKYHWLFRETKCSPFVT